MSIKMQIKIRDYIDKYRVVSLCNLKSHFPSVSKKDLFSMTSDLVRRKEIAFTYPKDKNPDRTYYYSKHFNPECSTTVFENDVVAIKKCLTVMDSFRKFYKIVYEDLAYFPSVIRFGIETNDGLIKNVQIIYVPYSENNDMAKHIGLFFDSKYDARYEPARYIVVEIPGMLQGDSPKEIAKYIPRTRGFALCSNDRLSAEFFTPDDLGVIVSDE